MTRIGLRIDVDTLRGTQIGVPNLLSTLEKHSIKGTFYFTVGPDNMGRHLFRLLKPTFFWKMLRSNAPGLYGWDILLRGTFGPGPVIGERAAQIIRDVAQAGHEIGFHAWDHHQWQMKLDRMDKESMNSWFRKGIELLEKIVGGPIFTTAAPSWKCNDATLKYKDTQRFLYNSDCRGENIFYPLVDGQKLTQPQIPVTLPTYDEVIGQEGITDENYNDHMLSLIRPENLNVLCIHAEVEGIRCKEMFDTFLSKARSRGFEIVPLQELLTNISDCPAGRVVPKVQSGREGWIASYEAEPLADARDHREGKSNFV